MARSKYVYLVEYAGQFFRESSMIGVFTVKGEAISAIANSSIPLRDLTMSRLRDSYYKLGAVDREDIDIEMELEEAGLMEKALRAREGKVAP